MRLPVAFAPFVVCVVVLTGCGSNEAEVPPQAPETVTAEPATPTIPPPRREELAAAWAEACPDAEPANRGLCKSKGIGNPDFTCDFALGEGEYRRYTTDLTLADDRWVLADPANACAIGE